MEELYFVCLKSQEAVIFSPSYLHIAMSNYLTLTDQHAKLAFPYVPIRLYRAHHESLVSKFVGYLTLNLASHHHCTRLFVFRLKSTLELRVAWWELDVMGRFDDWREINSSRGGYKWFEKEGKNVFAMANRGRIAD